MRITLFLFGVILATVGIALINWHVALIFFGVFTAYVAIRLGDSTPPARESAGSTRSTFT